MIRINLGQRKKPVGVVASASSAGGSDGTTTLVTKLRQLGVSPAALGGGPVAGSVDPKTVLRNILVVAGVGVVLNYTFTSYTEEELGKVNSELAQLQAEREKLDAEVAKRAGYEQERQRLEGEEKLVQAKVSTLDALSTGRDAPPRILEMVSRDLPAEVWLSEFVIRRDGAMFSGFSASGERVTDFMSQLDRSTYFREASPRIENQSDSQGGPALTRFEVAVKRRGADGS